MRDEILYAVCFHSVNLMDGWYPIPATAISEMVGTPVGKVRYHLRKLKAAGIVYSYHEGGMTDDGELFCFRGWGVTEKGKTTREYQAAKIEEDRIREKVFGF